MNTPLESATAPTLGVSNESGSDAQGSSVSTASGAEPIGGGQKMKLELYTLLQDFAPTEVYAVLFVARRLAMGRKKYGVLDPHDGTDWGIMKAEELADALVYEAAGVMRAA